MEGISYFTGIARAWFCVGSGELLCPVEWLHSMWLKCYVRQAFVAQRGTGVRERAKGVSLPPLQSPLPANNLAAARFPRLHLLASGRPGYGILPSRPQARVHAGLTWLVNCASAMLMPDTTPRLELWCCE